MNNKFYIIMGILAGIIIMLVISKFPVNPIMAASDGGTGSYIALTGTSKSTDPILWVIDTNKKVLLTYELVENPFRTRLVALRDMKYDMDLPDGAFYPNKKGGDELVPRDVKNMLDKLRKDLNEGK
jgi:hypothetical protein